MICPHCKNLIDSPMHELGCVDGKQSLRMPFMEPGSLNHALTQELKLENQKLKEQLESKDKHTAEELGLDKENDMSEEKDELKELMKKMYRLGYDHGTNMERNLQDLEKDMETIETKTQTERGRERKDNKRVYYIDESLDIQDSLMTELEIQLLGGLNCFKTKEEATMAKYCLIDLFYQLNEKFAVHDITRVASINFVIHHAAGREKAKTLRLKENQ